MRNFKLNSLVTLSIMLLSLYSTDIHAQIGMDLDEAIKIGTTTATTSGLIRYTGADFEGRTGGAWVSLTGGGAASPWTTVGNDVLYSDTGATYCRVNANAGGSVGYRLLRDNTIISYLWNDVTGDLILSNDGGGSRHLVIDGTTKFVGINEATPDEQLHVTAPGLNGIKVEGNDSGDTRLWITNGGGSHFLFDDDSDAHALKLQAADDLDFLTGGVNTRMRIDGVTGQVRVEETLRVDGASTLSGKVTASNDIELRGNDPTIDFWNPSPPGVGARIKFDENSSSGGNNGELEIRNYQIAGDITFYTSTTNTNLRMNDTNIYAYEPLSPWLHKTTNLGLNGKAWDNVYYDDLINQGAAAFVNRKVTEELLNYPPTEKKPGDFDYMTERGDVELDPHTLPPGLMEDDGILTDEMVSYNYHANYEQQQQIEALKKENENLRSQIAEILKLLDK